MTAKEKAENLIRKYYSFGINKEGQTLSWYECKQCTLITVNEVLKSIDWDYYEGSSGTELNWWQEVKREIENL